MWIPSPITTVLLVSVLTLVAGCSPERAMERRIEGEASGSANEAGGIAMPKNWPEDAPVYAGATVQFSGSVNLADGDKGTSMVLLTSDAAASVVAYYEKELRSSGWNIESTLRGQGMTVIGASKNGRGLSLAIGAAGDGKTSITIGVGER